MAILGRRNFFFIMCCLWIFNGCSQPLKLKAEWFPNSFEVNNFERGMMVSSRVLDKNHVGYTRMLDWYSNNLDGWAADYNTYVPATLFRSEELTINLILSSNIVVINYFDSADGWKQISKVVSANDRALLAQDIFEAQH